MYRALVLLILSLASAQAGLSRLDALGMIESGNNDFAVGRAGEVSRYQIKPRVWHHYTELTSYEDRELAAWVAGRYLASLEEAFEKFAGRTPSDFDLYVLWNAGLSYYKGVGFSFGRVSPAIRDRAQRFVNLRLKAGT